jgi:serine/threonine protein kinase SCH9
LPLPPFSERRHLLLPRNFLFSQHTLPTARTATMPASNALLTPHRAATHDDDGHDQIGSTSSTPPGASTPRPDPTDKRLPGILHSYFGQVRDSFMPQSKSSPKNSNPAPVTSIEPKEKDTTEKAAPRQTMLPSPAPSASSRTPSASQLNGETEKLTEGDFSSPQNQATPPQTPRTRSQEGKPPTSSLSRTSLASNNSRESKTSNKSDKDTAVVGPPKGKLAVVISEGRDLRASTDPYCVIQFQWAEYISDGPKHDDTKGRRGPMQMRRTESEMQRPMAIPMKSRQSSNSGHSSDARDDTFEETTNPTWEHEAELYVPKTHTPHQAPC